MEINIAQFPGPDSVEYWRTAAEAHRVYASRAFRHGDREFHLNEARKCDARGDELQRQGSVT